MKILKNWQTNFKM